MFIITVKVPVNFLSLLYLHTFLLITFTSGYGLYIFLFLRMSDNFWLDARHCNFYIVKCGFCCISLKYCSGTQEVTWRAMWTFWGLFLRFIVGWIHSSFYSSANLAHYLSATLLKMLPNAPSIRGSLYFDRWEYVFPDLWGTEIVWFTAFHSILCPPNPFLSTQLIYFTLSNAN